ncbi:hypothetical protein HYR99_15310 [Candidatus Poribacteria bacterium]|nr:hypothetical protein [Candidatus Poribacteria bacterium]
MRIKIQVLGFIIVFSTLVSPLPFETHSAAKKMPPAMLGFSQAILGLQKALDSGDIDAVLTHAETLKKAAEEVSDLKPHTNVELMQTFNEYRARISRLTSELVSFAREKDVAGVSGVVADMRYTCISCHIRFRKANAEIGLFPVLGNTIAGQVKILKLDGEERADRSNVVVFLDRVPSDAPLPRKKIVISQKDRTFTPRVLPIMKGMTVVFPNDDSIFHNVFSLSKTNPFDLDIYPPGGAKSVTFRETGWVKVYCNIHPQMIAHIIVLDNPFFAQTDSEGFFVISDVPDGTYALRTWHEFGGETKRDIKVSGTSLYNYALEIQEDKQFVEHKNKFGKPYKGKYQ